MTRRLAYFSTGISSLAGAAFPAAACGVCAAAMTWEQSRFLYAAGFVCLPWFLSLSILQDARKTPVPFVPPAVGAVGVVLLVGIFGYARGGPLLLYPLGLPAVIALILSFWKQAPFGWDKGDRRWIQVIGAFHLALALAAGAYLEAQARRMDEVDIMIKWGATPVGFKIRQDIMKRGADALPEYRKMVREGDSFVLSTGAGALAEWGDPATDVPLLLEAYERADTYDRTEVEEALRELTYLYLPQDSTPERWREALAARSAP
jgi:hypothetical protein